MEIKFSADDLEILSTLLADKVMEKVRLLLPQSKTDGLLTVSELAEYLKVKEAWVYQKVHTKEIPYRKVGGKLRFRKSEIDRMVDGR